MKFRLLSVSMLLAATAAVGGGLEGKLWQPAKGQAETPPEITAIETEKGPTVKIAAVADGPYQGVRLALPAALPLKDGMKITFSIRQSVRKQAITFAAIFGFDDKRSAGCDFEVKGNHEWTEVTLPVANGQWFKIGTKEPVPLGNANELYLYPYRALDAKGLSYEIANFTVFAADGKPIALSEPAPKSAAIADSAPPRGAPEATRYIKAEYWTGAQGQAGVAPEITVIGSPEAPAVKATAVAAGKYQGFEIVFPEPVDLENVGSISFDFSQNVRPGRAGDGAIIIRYADGRNGLLGNFKFTANEWSHVIVPIDLRTLQSLAKQSDPIRGKVVRIMITMYSSMSEPGQYLAIANLEFHPVSTAEGKIPVTGYTYLAPPTSGDESRTVLTDGKAEKADQAFYRQYADEPDIAFDLGAVYLIKNITLEAVAVPSQNISDLTVYTSKDGQKWQTAAHIANRDADANEKTYAITGTNLDIVGRYIRLRAGRSRTDIPVHIAEVAFTGKIPTDAEIAAVSARQYSTGPELPAISEKDYLHLADSSGNSLWINRQNGVAVKLERNGTMLAERLFNRYELFGPGAAELGQADGYTDRVFSCIQKDGGIEVATVNPKFPDLSFTTTWRWDNNILTRRLAIASKATAPRIFNTAFEVVLPQHVREGGLYETWGAGHDLQHKFASEIAFDYPADTGPVVIFENPKQGLTMLHYRYRYDDRYVQIGSGVVTIAGFGDKRTIFTPTGWILGDGLFAFNAKKQQAAVESQLAITPGDLTTAFDAYLAQPEVRQFRARIKRPAWLGELRFLCTQGWDGLWGDAGQRLAEFLNSLIREGVIHYGACDSDYFWGDFPTSGDVRNIFGGRMSAETMKARDEAIRKSLPNAKISQYTWLWSASKYSEVFKQHPEWFITHNAQNREISFFPGWGVNYYRLVGIPESRAEIIEAITRFMNFYNQEVWYLDGGGSPSSIDWPNMRIDEPDAWDQTLLGIRDSIRQDRPDRAVFFNNPENPIGDMGYLESFGGVMTTNWRDGATWMYKFKLWQRPDPLFTPLYIYWLPGVDQAFRQYAVGTGLGLTLGGDSDNRRDVATMSAQQQSRPARLVDAKIRPNWRYEPETQLEIMPLAFGDFGWLFLKNHADKPFRGEVSADLAPLGLRDRQKPVYQWLFTLKPHSTHRGLLGESEQEANYRASRWASDFIIAPEYLGQAPAAGRIAREIEVKPDQLRLYCVTQSPALVYSVDHLRNQLWLPETLGVKVSGAQQGDKIELAIDSARDAAEIVCTLPDAMSSADLQLDGKAAPVDMIVVGKARLALFAVTKGRHTAILNLQPVPKVSGSATLAVTPGKPGGKLMVKAATSGIPEKTPLTLEIFNAGDLVWQKTVTPEDAAAEIVLPTGVTGGTYAAKLFAPDGGMLAESPFELASGTPKIGKFVWLKEAEMKQDAKPYPAAVAAAPGVKALGEYGQYQPTTGTVRIDPAQAAVTISTLPLYATHWNFLAAGLELELKRYVKLRLRGNFDAFNREGPRPGFHGLNVRYDNSDCALGIMFDFADASGQYVTRTFAGTGRALAERRGTLPTAWGTKRVPENICVISNFAVGEAPEETFWVDLNELGAPADWSGKVILAPLYQNVTPDRTLEVTVLESQAELPAGAAAVKVFPLKGGKPAEVKQFQLPRVSGKIAIDGKVTAEEWNNALSLKEFSLCGSPAQLPPATEIKLQRDGGTLYVAAILTETKPSGFTVDPNGKPWFTDSIEIYLASADNPKSYVQYILSGSNTSHAEWVSSPEPGQPRRTLPAPDFKTRLEGDKLYIEAALPLAALGSVDGKKLKFNLGRNRMVNGNLEPYTMAPGKSYINFTGAELAY